MARLAHDTLAACAAGARAVRAARGSCGRRFFPAGCQLRPHELFAARLALAHTTASGACVAPLARAASLESPDRGAHARALPPVAPATCAGPRSKHALEARWLLDCLPPRKSVAEKRQRRKSVKYESFSIRPLTSSATFCVHGPASFTRVEDVPDS